MHVYAVSSTEKTEVSVHSYTAGECHAVGCLCVSALRGRIECEGRGMREKEKWEGKSF